MDWTYKKIAISTAVAISTGAAMYVLYKSSFLFLSALVGVGISSLMTPLVKKINNKYNIPKFLSATILISGIILIFLFLFFAVGSVAWDQLETLKEKWPEISNFWQEKIGAISSYTPAFNNLFEIKENTEVTSKLFGYFGRFLSDFAKFGTGLSLAIVIAIFTSINSRTYTAGLLSLTPEKYKSELKKRLDLSATTIRKWFMAQVLDLLIVGLLTSICLWALGIKYWALYGLMTSIFCFIPYVGIISVVILSGAITLVLQPDLFVYHLGALFIIQQIEANIILPKLMKKHTETPAALLVFFLLLSGIWLGFLGVFLAAPLLALIISQIKYSEGLEP